MMSPHEAVAMGRLVFVEQAAVPAKPRGGTEQQKRYVCRECGTNWLVSIQWWHWHDSKPEETWRVEPARKPA